MHHLAKKVEFLDGTLIEVLFQDGKVFQYDIAEWFVEYPQFKALEDRKLFLSGHTSSFSIIWNDELDLGLETAYEDGVLVRTEEVPIEDIVGNEIGLARESKLMSQSELADITGINQADISRIEAGKANPSLKTLKRIAEGLGKRIEITFVDK